MARPEYWEETSKNRNVGKSSVEDQSSPYVATHNINHLFTAVNNNLTLLNMLFCPYLTE